MVLAFLLVVSVAAPTLPASAAEGPPAPLAGEDRPVESHAPTALRLIAAAEEAWVASDAERLASLVDTTAVRIAVKPGAPLATALTRVAAAFLFQDQLRLVQTQGFRVTKFELDTKKTLCRATAIWTGDWGGRRGKRAVRVALTARPSNNRWLLTEIRAED